ncbi:MAG TPA: hypothetical protein VI365_27320 [Trebonia sp.]
MHPQGVTGCGLRVFLTAPERAAASSAKALGARRACCRSPYATGLLLAGDAATRLEQLVSRLSLEPGIHAVHWHTADDPSPLPVTAPAPAADAAGAGDQG